MALPPNSIIMTSKNNWSFKVNLISCSCIFLISSRLYIGIAYDNILYMLFMNAHFYNLSEYNCYTSGIGPKSA